MTYRRYPAQRSIRIACLRDARERRLSSTYTVLPCSRDAEIPGGIASLEKVMHDGQSLTSGPAELSPAAVQGAQGNSGGFAPIEARRYKKPLLERKHGPLSLRVTFISHFPSPPTARSLPARGAPSAGLDRPKSQALVSEESSKQAARPASARPVGERLGAPPPAESPSSDNPPLTRCGAASSRTRFKPTNKP